jgi:hypothetical protein
MRPAAGGASVSGGVSDLDAVGGAASERENDEPTFLTITAPKNPTSTARAIASTVTTVRWLAL